MKFERAKDYSDLIQKEIAAVTGRSVDEISVDLPFAQLGIESLQAVTIISQIGTKLNRDLPVTLMFDYPTIQELAGYLFNPDQSQDHYNGKSRANEEPIAIVGLACRFPRAQNKEEFWKNLIQEIDAISEVPEDRWDWKNYSRVRWGGFLSDIDSFDNEMFQIPEIEATKMDPQQRLLMEVTFEAIEDSGYAPRDLSKTLTGVFVGISSNDYSIFNAQLKKTTDVFDTTGNAHSISANRLSYLLNMRGPSMSIDTACSSSLVALHLACQSLEVGDSDAAIVAGVNLILKPELSMAFAEAGMLAPDGRCKAFSKEANGYVRGEGVGVIIVKRLSDAIRDQDQVYCVIKGSAINQDGKTSSLTAPNGLAQESVIQKALLKSQLKPQDIDFIEAHGTGTSLGDPIEYLSLERVFQGIENKKIGVASTKTNIGHLEAAAGIVGVIKVALALQNKTWPKHLHFTSLNPKIGDRAPHLYVVSQKQDLSAQKVLRAGVSSFGFGGTNSHVVLESAPVGQIKKETSSPTKPRPKTLFLSFSSTSEDSLQRQALRFSQTLRSVPDSELYDFCQSSYQKRNDYKERICTFAENRESLQLNLTQWMSGQKPAQMVHQKISKNYTPRVAFAFTGQGSQYKQMADDLYRTNSSFRTCFEECCQHLDQYFSYSIREITLADSSEKEALLMQTDYGQACLFALEYALAQMLIQDFKIIPDLVFGHSLGEVVAATIAGRMSLLDACRLVSMRGKLMQNTQVGSMLVVFASSAECDEMIRSHKKVHIAAINGPKLCVLSGDPTALKFLHQQNESKKIRSQFLKVNRAFHSSFMDPILEQFENSIESIQFQSGHYDLVSSMTGLLHTDPYTSAYWKKHLREPTQFLQSMQTVAQMGINTIIEIGPRPTLTAMGPACTLHQKINWHCLLHNDHKDSSYTFKNISELFCLGLPQKQSKEKFKLSQKLPPTSFTKKSFWLITKNSNPIKENPMSSEKILSEITEMLAKLMQIRPDELNPDENLTEMGADSLLLLNAIQTIKDKYGVSIAISDVFRDLSNLRAISQYISQNTNTHSTTTAPISTPTPMIAQTPAAPQQAYEMTALMNAQAASTPITVSNDVRGIIEQQLKLMNHQLALLGGSPAQMPVTSQHVVQSRPLSEKPSATATATTATEAKGVLGNFRNFANREATADEKNKDRYVQELSKKFSEKTKSTKSHTQKFRKPLADNRVSAGFRPNIKEMIYPIIFRTAKGSRFHDLDGHEYIDFSMGFGVNLFGHSPEFIEKRIRTQMDLGYCVGPQAELAGIVAQKVCDLTGHERAAFCNSGTEAVMTAIRLARAVTKRNKIVIFDGSYHGHFDGVLARAQANYHSIPVASGVTQGFVNDIAVLQYGSNEALDFIRKNANELAAVLVEPVQSRYPENQPVEFLREIRKITEQSGTAFIWDEVICGFRVSSGGAQKHFGIKGDLASYGKVLGGGLPIGAIAGKAKFLDAIDGGHWQFGDQSYPEAEMTFFAGTFCKHPLAMAAADAVLDRIKSEGDSLFENLNKKTELVKNRLNQFFAEQAVDIHVNNFGSLFRFKANANLDLLFVNLNLRGTYVWEGRNLFMSTAHTDEDIEQFIQHVKDSTLELIREGFLRKKI